MSVILRSLDASEQERWYDQVLVGFPTLSEPPEERAFWLGVLERDWAIAAHDESSGQLVGTAGGFSFEVSVPGGDTVPAVGLTMVGVSPTHRRQGVLTRMMRRHLDQARERGLPLALLTASEPAIYGRFGYGVAAWRLAAEIDTTRVALAEPGHAAGVRLRLADADEVLPLTERLYARQVRERPGMLVRQPGWERLETLYPASERAGRAPLRCVLAERDGELVGYARYTTAGRVGGAGLEGAVRLRALEAVDPGASAALWRFLLSIDLTTRLTAANRPVDDPWQYLVSDIRQCGVGVSDSLYLRPLEVGAALAARRYTRQIDVVLDIADDFCPWNSGRWRLAGGPDGATCAPTTAAADLRMSARELGAGYLGGTPLTALHRAGLVAELSPGAVGAASAAFSSPVAPWLPHTF